MMLISGACNTLLMKFMVIQQVPTGAGKAAAGFEHPFLQTLFMMIGEVLCLGAFFMSLRKQASAARQATSVPSWIFLVPCMCDWTATTLVNMAYVMIPASVIQMTRGAIVIFTCAMSMVFLGRRQHVYHGVGVGLVVVGITLVSLSALLTPHGESTAGPLGYGSGVKVLGLSLCIFAQVFQASMIVYEEKIMHGFSVPPLQVVGMEGLFGIGIGIVLLSVVNGMGYESTSTALYQMSASKMLVATVIASIFSIAIFNYSGVTVTQKASATARSTIDVSRTILIWAVELLLGWNTFSWLQLGGFVLVACGTLLYNRLVVIQWFEPPVEAESLQKAAEKERP